MRDLGILAEMIASIEKISARVLATIGKLHKSCVVAGVKIPKQVYSAIANAPIVKHGRKAANCDDSVCLAPFEKGRKRRLLPLRIVQQGPRVRIHRRKRLDERL